MSAVDQALQHLRQNKDFVSNVAAWERIPPREARYGQLPLGISARLTGALARRGVERFYSHQCDAIGAVLRGENVVVSTTTASGKSLIYTIPVMQSLIDDDRSRALYLFPTKALSQDQLTEADQLVREIGLSSTVATFDGDTPRSRRKEVRLGASIVITNPDMLHVGIMPQHTAWRSFFSNLRFVVIDEMHAYRGVFGSNVANVIRRLKRICRFYGSNPQFICCSATIANPIEHAGRITEEQFTLVDESQNGAPRGEKQFILYNPPLIDAQLGIRQNLVMASRDAALSLLRWDMQIVVFARARQSVELLLGYLRDAIEARGKDPQLLAGYRGGYLPGERREIERGLKNGSLLGVVATNALELGVDIGELSGAVIVGYPGSIASTWQQAGRAGRRNEKSTVLMIAGNNPLDQYLCANPGYLLGNSPEHALCNPDNKRIVLRHIACAAFELPFGRKEEFGNAGMVEELLRELEESNRLHRTSVGGDERFSWSGEGSPFERMSLRTSGDETVLIQNISHDKPVVIGEVDLARAAREVFEGAVYSHRGETHVVELFDWDGRRADARAVEVDYYTRAAVRSVITEMRPEEQQEELGVLKGFGDVKVVSTVTGFRKIKRYTHETLGYGEIDLPDMTLETRGYWIVIGEKLERELQEAGILSRPNEYGPNWPTQRKRALERDGHRCSSCGAEQNPIRALHVHHTTPFKEFGYRPGENDAYLVANELSNLATLCSSCHRDAEAGQQRGSSLSGLAYVMRNISPLFLMADRGDIQVNVEQRSPVTKAPTLVVYESASHGVGFSERLFELHERLLQAGLQLISGCDCRDGCPSCVGPPGEIGPETKLITATLLRRLLGQSA